MQINADNRTKVRLAQSQYAFPNKLLRAEEAERRKQMSDDELVKLFERIWESYLKPAVETAESCDVHFVRSKLKEKSQSFVDNSQEHRAFRLKDINLEFIVQLKPNLAREYELTQIWFIPSTDYDPKCILICFKDVEEKKRFTELAKQLNYNDAELARELILDFLKKHQR